MSDIYYLGTYNKNTNGYYEINKPIKLTGITANFIRDLLDKSNINEYEHFTHCDTTEVHKPLFYTIDKEWSGPLDEKYEDCYECGVNMENIGSSKYPLICDGVERDGEAYYIKTNNILEQDYSDFKKLDITKDTISNYVKDNKYYKNNNDDWIMEELIEIYNKIALWINNNEKIYWYHNY